MREKCIRLAIVFVIMFPCLQIEAGYTCFQCSIPPDGGCEQCWSGFDFGGDLCMTANCACMIDMFCDISGTEPMPPDPGLPSSSDICRFLPICRDAHPTAPCCRLTLQERLAIYDLDVDPFEMGEFPNAALGSTSFVRSLAEIQDEIASSFGIAHDDVQLAGHIYSVSSGHELDHGERGIVVHGTGLLSKVSLRGDNFDFLSCTFFQGRMPIQKEYLLDLPLGTIVYIQTKLGASYVVLAYMVNIYTSEEWEESGRANQERYATEVESLQRSIPFPFSFGVAGGSCQSWTPMAGQPAK